MSKIKHAQQTKSDDNMPAFCIACVSGYTCSATIERDIENIFDGAVDYRFSVIILLERTLVND